MTTIVPAELAVSVLLGCDKVAALQEPEELEIHVSPAGIAACTCTDNITDIRYLSYMSTVFSGLPAASAPPAKKPLFAVAVAAQSDRATVSALVDHVTPLYTSQTLLTRPPLGEPPQNRATVAVLAAHKLERGAESCPAASERASKRKARSTHQHLMLR
jgi:hypothetical protein